MPLKRIQDTQEPAEMSSPLKEELQQQIEECLVQARGTLGLARGLVALNKDFQPTGEQLDALIINIHELISKLRSR